MRRRGNSVAALGATDPDHPRPIGEGMSDAQELADPVPQPSARRKARVRHPRPRYLPAGRLFALVMAAALVGGGTAALVAGATGWGARTVVNRYVTNTSSLTERPVDIRNLLVAVLPAVVSITAAWPTSNPLAPPGSTLTAAGTGIVVTSDGEVVTNEHIVSGAAAITVTLNGSTTPLPATVIGIDAAHDIVLLKITGASELPVLEFGDSTKLVTGDGVIAVGYALGMEGGPTVTAGIISATGREITTRTPTGIRQTLTGLLQTDAPVSSGSSGGPLIDAAGHVVGINTITATSTGSTAANGISFAIASQTISSLLPALRQGG